MGLGWGVDCVTRGGVFLDDEGWMIFYQVIGVTKVAFPFFSHPSPRHHFLISTAIYPITTLSHSLPALEKITKPTQHHPPHIFPPQRKNPPQPPPIKTQTPPLQIHPTGQTTTTTNPHPTPISTCPTTRHKMGLVTTLVCSPFPTHFIRPRSGPN